MFEITVGVYTGERAVLDKWNKTGSRLTLTGSVRGDIDLVSPSVKVNRNLLPFYNYAYIPEFSGYYYITEINDYTRDISIITLKRDPLQTFAAGIKASPAIAARASDNHVNADYPDGKYKVLQSHDTSVINIGNLGLANTVILGFIK